MDIKKELQKIDWYFYHKRKRTMLALYFYFYASAFHCLDWFKCYVKNMGSSCHRVLVNNTQQDHARKKLWNTVLADPKFVLDGLQEAYREWDEALIKLRILASRELGDKSPKELLEQYNSYVEIVSPFSKYIFVPLIIDDQLNKSIFALLSDKELDIVFEPLRKSYSVREQLSLLKLCLKKNSPDFNHQLEKHIETFSFLKNKGMFFDFYDRDYYLNKINQINDAQSQLDKLELEHNNHLSKFNSIINQFEDKNELLIQITNEAIFFRTWRSEILEHSSWYLKDIVKEIEKRTGCNIAYLTPEEVGQLLLEKRDFKDEIEKRKQALVMMTFGEKIHVLSGDEAIEFDKTLLAVNLKESNLKGQPAFKGVVKGKAVVVASTEDFHKIKHGEVLIAHTTTPEIVPFLKDIKAIVTEEGGILSHPAVISREMKVPCIIGVAGCTEAIKDSQLVEVDADKGVVNILDS